MLLLEHDIPHSSFSQSVLDCLPEMPWGITAADEERRVDCRHLDICSVDPPGCTDIDDALHARQGFLNPTEITYGPRIRTLNWDFAVQKLRCKPCC